MKRILLGALAGGMVLFLWGAISHMVLQIGDMGITPLPAEDTLMQVMEAHINRDGFYFFPGMDMTSGDREQAWKDWERKFRRGPWGVMIYHPHGQEPMPPSQLFFEFLSDVLASLVAAFLIVQIPGSLARRTLMVAMLGVFSWLTVHLPYWNWYGFPGLYTASQLLDGIIGWGLAGLALAAVVKPLRRATG